jgi:DNA-binding response OmpR family regulator
VRRLLLLTLAALMALPGLAAAGERVEKQRAPSARLEAVGDGRIVLAGRLVAYGQMGGRATSLIVQDMAGDAVVIVAGHRLEPNARGWVRLRRPSGRLYVSGSRVTVRVSGSALNLAVAGNGGAILVGDGRYWLNGGAAAAWSGERLRIESGEVSSAAARAARARPRRPRPGVTVAGRGARTPTWRRGLASAPMAPDAGSRPLVLIVEDEANIASFARMYLEAAGYRVILRARGDDGLRAALEEDPALVVLDLMLPGIDGFEVTRRLRRERQTPIVILTARDEAVDTVVGLELGADDYITKPFDPRELVARVRAVLRRAEARAANGPRAETLEHDAVRIEVGAREVYAAGERVALTPKEFDLLHTLVQHRGLVLTREQLLERVWGYTFLGDSRTIDVHVRQLRRKLGEACPIQTVWGTGYKVPAKR